MELCLRLKLYETCSCRSELAQKVGANGLAENVQAFNTNYNDAGLFGVYATAKVPEYHLKAMVGCVFRSDSWVREYRLPYFQSVMCSQPDSLDDLCYVIMHEFGRLIYRVDPDDVARARNQVRQLLSL